MDADPNKKVKSPQVLTCRFDKLPQEAIYKIMELVISMVLNDRLTREQKKIRVKKIIRRYLKDGATG